MDVDPNTYPDLDIARQGDATQVVAKHAGSNLRTVYFALIGIGLVPLGLGLIGGAIGEVPLDRVTVIVPFSVVVVLLAVLALRMRSTLTFRTDTLRWWRGPLPFPRSGTLRRSELAAIRLKVQQSRRTSEGYSPPEYHVTAHPRSGKPVLLGSFTIEKRAKQLLGLCRAWLGS